MKERWDQLLTRYEAFSARERWVVLVAVLAVVYGVFDFTVLETHSSRRDKLEASRKTAEVEFARAEQLAREAAAAWELDPDEEGRRQAHQLEQQLADLDRRLSEETVDLIAPERMVAVLEEVLREIGGLELVRLESLSARYFSGGIPEPAETRVAPSSSVYEHGFRLELKGRYPEALRYLRALEEQPRQLFWDGLQYEVLEYPDARIQIDLHTLSDRESWVGV